jgi:hypothetical protein
MYTIQDLRERLDLPESELDALAAFTGERCFGADGAPLAIFDEQALADHAQIYRETCAEHGIFRCQDCRDDASVQYPDVTVPLSGEDGNGAAIIGRVAKAIRRAHGAEAAHAYAAEARASRSYDDLLTHAMRTVNVE